MVAHQVDVPSGAWGRTASPGQGPRAVDLEPRFGCDVGVVTAEPLAGQDRYILGTEVIQDDSQTRQRQFQFIKGPIFANVVLADEVNRTPPKTQAA